MTTELPKYACLSLAEAQYVARILRHHAFTVEPRVLADWLATDAPRHSVARLRTIYQRTQEALVE